MQPNVVMTNRGTSTCAKVALWLGLAQIIYVEDYVLYIKQSTIINVEVDYFCPLELYQELLE